jgi:hypothetical protein
MKSEVQVRLEKWQLAGVASSSSVQTKRKGKTNGNQVEDTPDTGESSVPRGSVRNRV